MNGVNRDTDGKYPSYAWPGGYPILYLTDCGAVICPNCANEGEDGLVSSCFPHYSGHALDCDECGKIVESAYGPEDEGEVE